MAVLVLVIRLSQTADLPPVIVYDNGTDRKVPGPAGDLSEKIPSAASTWRAVCFVTRCKVRAPEAAASSVGRQARERTIPRHGGPIRCGARTHGRPNFTPQPAGPSRGVARTFRCMDHLNFTPRDTSD